jgi:hypothetical protein
MTLDMGENRERMLFLEGILGAGSLGLIGLLLWVGSDQPVGPMQNPASGRALAVDFHKC